MLSARLALGVAERARDVFLEPRRHAVGRDGGAGHEAPRMVGKRLGRRRFYERSTRHGRGHGGAAAEKGTTVQTPVHRLHSRPPASPWIKRVKAPHERRGGLDARGMFASEEEATPGPARVSPYCFTATPRTTTPGSVPMNGASRLLSMSTKSNLSVPVPPVMMEHTTEPVPLECTVYVHVKVWWSTEAFTLRVRTPSVRFPFPSATKNPTAATGPTPTIAPSKENP